jgi:tryptophan 2,3-dioxygenase
MGERHFGEEGARLSYGSYLHLPELLQQQDLQSEPPAHDELLFITVHQVCELWFKQCLHELGFARDEMLAGRSFEPRKALQRVHSIEQILIEQVVVLETMTPQDFLAFRSLLAPASGFQSVQFRELEFLSGARDAAYVERLRQASADERGRLQTRLAEPSLWDAFLSLLDRRGLPVTTAGERRQAFLGWPASASTPSCGSWPRRC